MDPNENLRKQLSLARIILSRVDAGEDTEGTEDFAAELAELVIALDAWIRAGFLPSQWGKQ